jgi:hypothetical protein
MDSHTPRSSPAPWILTALVMLGAGVVVFYGADMIKQQQAQLDTAEHLRSQAVQRVSQLELQVTALTHTLTQVASERDAAAARLAALQAATDETKPAPVHAK